MSQHDLTIANQGFPAFRADLNSALQALGSCQSGTSAPSPTFANQLWYDTTNNILKIRNEDNDAWISVVTLDQSTDAVTAIGSLTLADIVSLTASQTLTNKTLTNPTINGFTGDTSVINIGSGQLYKSSAGVFGVGTTTPAGWTSPFKAMQFSDQGAVMATAASMQIGNNIYYDGSYKFIGTGYAQRYYQSGGNHTWATSSTSGSAGGAVTENINLNLSPDGCLALKGGTTTASVGIAFPATQVASSNANTLDDYEEGTWTPTLQVQSGSASSATYTGSYIKIGKQVTLTIEAAFITTSSLVIDGFGGIPFTSSSTGGIAVGSIRENASTGNQYHWRVNVNSTGSIVRRYDNNSNISNGYTLVGTVTYFTN